MNRISRMTLLAGLLTAAGSVHAQNSVTLYGLLDDSMRYVSNSGGHSLWTTASGIQGNRWGLIGSEDLGGGLKSIFRLENGFNPNTGALGQGGRMFGRHAWVGLSDTSFGALTLGRQLDPVVDLVQPLTADRWGSSFVTPGDVDNNDNSARISNSIKYASPVFAGFQVEAMYALGGVAGATGAGQTWAAAATYATGPLSVAAGYLRMDNTPPTTGALRSGWSGTADGTFDGGLQNIAYQTARSIGIASAAAQYVTGPFTVGLRYSNAQYRPDAHSAFGSTQKYDVGAGFLSYRISPAALIGLGYTYTHGGGDASASYNQVSLAGVPGRWMATRKRYPAQRIGRACPRRGLGRRFWLQLEQCEPDDRESRASAQVLTSRSAGGRLGCGTPTDSECGSHRAGGFPAAA